MLAENLRELTAAGQEDHAALLNARVAEIAPTPEGTEVVSVDQSLPKEERIAEFLRQIKNPYCFRCGKFTVRARFADNGVSLEDCLKQILI